MNPNLPSLTEAQEQDDLDLALLKHIAEGNILEVTKVLSLGAHPTYFDSHSLRIVAQTGHLAIAKLLIQYGADIHADGNAILHTAVANKHPEICSLLIQHGVDPHIGNVSPLYLAISRNYTDIALIIINSKATLDDPKSKIANAFKWALEVGNTEFIEHLVTKHGCNPQDAIDSHSCADIAKEWCSKFLADQHLSHNLTVKPKSNISIKI